MISTDIGINKLAEVCPIIGDLVERLRADEEWQAAIIKARTEKTNDRVFTLKVVLPHLLKNYKDLIYEVLAVFNEQSIDEIKEQDVFITVNKIKELLTDKSVMGFISSFVGQSPKATSEVGE